MQALVVGAGAIGCWFGEVLNQWTDVRFFDKDPAASDQAITKVGGAIALTELPKSVPIVCTAVPIRATRRVLEDVAPRATNAVIDLSGTMEEPHEIMEQYAPGCERINLHPLFAPENEPGNIPLSAANGGPVTERINNELNRRGNHVFNTTPSDHDRAMVQVQSKVHAALLAYALSADTIDPKYHTTVSREFFELTRQILSGPETVYADIQHYFDGSAEIAAAASELAEADIKEFETLYERAQSSFENAADVNST